MNSYVKIIIQLGNKTYEMFEISLMKIEKKVNCHVQAELCGKINTASKLDLMKVVCCNSEIEVFLVQTETDNSKKPLFRGVIKSCKLASGGIQAVELRIQAVSHSIALDITPQNRSFQNTKMTYQALLDRVKANNSNAVVDMATKDKELGIFTIQYKETDWEFLFRLASRFQTGLVANGISPMPKLWFGIPDLYDRGDIRKTDLHYSVKRNITAFRDYKANFHGDDGALVEENFTRYELWTDEFFNIGDRLTVEKIKLVVCEAWAFLDGQRVFFKCAAAPEDGLKQKLILNKRIVGHSIRGKVLEAGGEGGKKDYIKVHLEIDKEQKKEEATWFPYSTVHSAEGNTGVYCIPKTGEIVDLFFPTAKAEDAMVSAALRENYEKRLDPDTKVFQTEHGKVISFSEQDLVIAGENEALFVHFNDEQGINMSSPEKLKIATDKKLRIAAKNRIFIKAASTVKLNCKNSRFVMDESEQTTEGEKKAFNFYGKVRQQDGTPAPKIDFNIVFPKSEDGEEEKSQIEKLYYVAAAAAISEKNNNKYVLDIWRRKSTIVAGNGKVRGDEVDLNNRFSLNDEKIEDIKYAKKVSKSITSWYEDTTGVHVSGNFDGMGMSVGILQWNLGKGTLQPMLEEMIAKYGSEFDALFDFPVSKTGKKGSGVLKEKLKEKTSEQVLWADSISILPGKRQLASPWHQAFARLVKSANYKKIQDKHAENYFSRANKIVAWMKTLGIEVTTRAYALAFDIAVQNGGMGVFENSSYGSIMKELVQDTIQGKETVFINPNGYKVYPNDYKRKNANDNSCDYPNGLSQNQIDVIDDLIKRVKTIKN